MDKFFWSWWLRLWNSQENETTTTKSTITTTTTSSIIRADSNHDFYEKIKNVTIENSRNFNGNHLHSNSSQLAPELVSGTREAPTTITKFFTDSRDFLTERTQNLSNFTRNILSNNNINETTSTEIITKPGGPPNTNEYNNSKDLITIAQKETNTGILSPHVGTATQSEQSLLVNELERIISVTNNNYNNFSIGNESNQISSSSVSISTTSSSSSSKSNILLSIVTTEQTASTSLSSNATENVKEQFPPQLTGPLNALKTLLKVSSSSSPSPSPSTSPLALSAAPVTSSSRFLTTPPKLGSFNYSTATENLYYYDVPFNLTNYIDISNSVYYRDINQNNTNTTSNNNTNETTNNINFNIFNNEVLNNISQSIINETFTYGENDFNSDYSYHNSNNSNNNNNITEINDADFLISSSSNDNDDFLLDKNTEEYLLNLFLNCSENLQDCCALLYNQSVSSPGTNLTFLNNVFGTNYDISNNNNNNYYYNFNTTNCSIFGNLDKNSNYDLVALLQFISILATAIILGFIILATVIGNVFVIAAILLERNLQSVSNYLILSLAVADLLVACLVMPLSAVYEVSQEWKLGSELCDMWTSCDVLCCTASILHLVAIALDRYWAVTNIDYIHQRTARRIFVMILIIWGLSSLVSIAPLLGWKDPEWDKRVNLELKCMVSQDIGYQIFATASSFYVPLLVILVLYWRIFQTARKRIRRRQQVTTTPPASGGLIATAAGGSGGIAAAVVTVIGRPLPTISETTTAFTNISSTHTSPEKGSYGNGVDRNCAGTIENDPPTADISTYGGGPQQQSSSMKHSSMGKPGIARKKTQTSVDSKRERKAAKTLAIITGAFVCCWLPFFILAILLPMCPKCDISPLIMSLSLWLGYFNSTLNPIIYTIFSPEFRHAFKRILCGRRNSIRRRVKCVRR